MLLILINIISYGIQDFLGKIGIKYTSPLNLLFIRYIIIGLLLLISIGLFFEKKRNELLNLDKKTIGIASLLGVLSLIGGWSIYKLFETINFSYIIPIIKPLQIILSVLLGIILLKEHLSFKQIIGISLILLGIILVK